MIKTYIGLGGNLEEPVFQIKQALHSLNILPSSEMIRHSSFYRSQPLGNISQPDFINAVAEVETNLSPKDLLHVLQTIEQNQHRVRSVRWGPRTIDLDILLYGNQVHDTEALTIPHPGLKTREFVIYPLAEIAPDLVLPDGESILEVKLQTPMNGLQVIEV